MSRSIFLLLSFGTAAIHAAGPPAADEIVRSIGEPHLAVEAVGVTAERRTVSAIVHRKDLALGGDKTRVLLIGHTPEAAKIIHDALTWFYRHDDAAKFRDPFLVTAVPQASPGRAAPRASFPPAGVAYADAESPEAQYLWRWIGMHAPDLVVEVGAGTESGWFVPDAEDLGLERLRAALTPAVSGEKDELAAALAAHASCDVGRIAAVRGTGADGATFLADLLAGLQSADFHGPSPARRELQERLDRTPRQVAEQLSRYYGHELPQAVYIPAMALIGRLELGDLLDDPSHVADVKRIVAPYVEGREDSTPTNGSALSGHLIFSTLAERSEGESRRRYLDLARRAADLAFDDEGRPRESMPFHLEMSDSVFMGGPILAHVGKLTGDERYFDACLRHLRFMRERVLRDDGLYRHSPLDEAAWGRGNGFPALGLALCLTHWPEERDDRAELLAMFRDHLAAIKRRQDRSGAWRQVIDRPDSYRELSCTSMIAFAAARGVREGWVDAAEYDPLIRRAWSAIRLRVAEDGTLVDVCTGTGKQKTLDDYYRRPAILGRDPRGGAMALLAGVEIASYIGNGGARGGLSTDRVCQ